MRHLGHTHRQVDLEVCNEEIIIQIVIVDNQLPPPKESDRKKGKEIPFMVISSNPSSGSL